MKDRRVVKEVRLKVEGDEVPSLHLPVGRQARNDGGSGIPAYVHLVYEAESDLEP